eukprot:scaffold201441_cov19-Prasinocladus_malaysianus.AAC.1
MPFIQTGREVSQFAYMDIRKLFCFFSDPCHMVDREALARELPSVYDLLVAIIKINGNDTYKAHHLCICRRRG